MAGCVWSGCSGTWPWSYFAGREQMRVKAPTPCSGCCPRRRDCAVELGVCAQQPEVPLAMGALFLILKRYRKAPLTLPKSTDVKSLFERARPTPSLARLSPSLPSASLIGKTACSGKYWEPLWCKKPALGWPPILLSVQ